MPPDNLEARRWLRELFRTLGEKHPALKTTEARSGLPPSLNAKKKEDSNHDEAR